ncbi:MAG: PD-(D/E)XK nuclease family protein [Elusimicrobiota bacterium]
MKDIREWLDSHPAPKPQARPKGVEVSYSQVNAYLACPWLFKIVYVDFKRPPLHPKSSLGVSIHRALEAYHRENAADLERMLILYDENWVHAGFSSAPEELEWHRKGRRIVELYWTRDQERRSEILAVEKDFFFPHGPHAVRGTIDRIDRLPDGRVEVIDYKTHAEVETAEQAAQNLQLAMYGLGARESLGLEPALLSLHYVALDKKTSVAPDPAREEAVLELVGRVADIIAGSKSYTPDLAHCPSCDFRKTCPHSTARD